MTRSACFCGIGRTIFVTALAAVAVLAVLPASPAHATDCYWVGDPNSPGDWLDPSNWDPSSPGEFDNAYVDNGGTASIAAGEINVFSIFAGERNAAGFITQSGGTTTFRRYLYLGKDHGGTGSYYLTGGMLVAEDWPLGVIVGENGTGQFVQTGGTHLISDHGYLYVGYCGGMGSYTLSGGLLSAYDEKVGGVGSGSGSFFHLGGTNIARRSMLIASSDRATGTYAFSAGSFVTPSLTVGQGGNGSFIQSGGLAGVEENLILGKEPGSTGTYALSGGTVAAKNGVIGYRGIDLFDQSGGAADFAEQLLLGSESGATGRYLLSGGSLAAGSATVGYLGVGGFTQSGGQASIAGRLFVSDSYQMTDGTLSAGNAKIFGASASRQARFDQSGGLATFQGPLHIGTNLRGTFVLSGGSLLCQGEVTISGGDSHAIFIQSGGTATFQAGVRPGASTKGTYRLTEGIISGSGAIVGDEGNGLFEQSGGSAAFSEGIVLGNVVSGTGTYAMSGGTLAARNGTIGYGLTRGGIGIFDQSGGSAAFSQNLILGYEPGGTGTYTLSGGRLDAGAGIVGNQGRGSVAQSGGSASFNSSLFVGLAPAGRGTYELSGGQLQTIKTMVGPQGRFIQTGGLHIGSVSTDGQYVLSGGCLRAHTVYVVNEFTLGRWGELSIESDLNLGHSAAHSPIFHAEPFSTIHMTGPGARVANYSTDPSGLADLAQVWMIFQASGNDISLGRFEVAGKDLGPAPAGYQDNFALGVLELGGSGINRTFTLTDVFDSQPDWSGREALYVDVLMIHQGVFLDPGPFSLYYRNHGADVKRFFGGDVNLDGAVDGADLALMGSHWHRSDGPATREEGDLNGDGQVDGGDLALLGGTWNHRTEDYVVPLSGPAPGGQGVPEPAGLLLLALGGAALATRRPTAR